MISYDSARLAQRMTVATHTHTHVKKKEGAKKKCEMMGKKITQQSRNVLENTRMCDGT